MGAPGGSGGGFLYERLAAEVVELVRAGTLRPGERVPSVRRMSERWGVSVPTVLRACRLLEARRVIRARPRSGFYVQPPDRLRLPAPGPTAPPREPRAVTTGDLIVRFLEAVGDPALVPLGAAIPDPALLPVARLARHLGRVARRAGARGRRWRRRRGARSCGAWWRGARWRRGCGSGRRRWWLRRAARKR